MKLPLLIFALCAALAVAIAGCGGSTDSSSSSSDSTESSASTEARDSTDESSGSTESSSGSTESNGGEKTKPTVKVPKGIPSNHYAFKELEEGTGATAKSGDEVTVQYVGVGYDSEEEFDSSWSRNEPFTFTLGAGEVIKGWDKGVAGMKVGGRRELLIPGDLAYGPEGRPPSIGPNETLIFVIDLLAVK
jgi:peptidylprolyl isomerase